MMDFLRDSLKTLLSGTPAERSGKMATLVVPGFVLSCILSQFTGLGMLAGSENAVTAVRLPLYVDEKGTSAVGDGVAFILEPEVGSFLIPWTEGQPKRVWLSYEGTEYEANRERVRVEQDGIGGTLPLLGSSRPIVIVAEGGVAGDPLVEGRVVSPEELGLYSREGAAKALWSFVISMFGFGLIIRSTDSGELPVAEEAQESAS